MVDGEGADLEPVSLACLRSGSYSPYAADAAYPSGPVEELPWRGIDDGGDDGAYPAGDEDFRGYADLPATVECAWDKHRRSHLDVTAGCLRAVSTGGDQRYERGQIETTSDGYFRALALGHEDGAEEPVKWTDQTVEYRFHHAGRTDDEGNPGFKAFVRYRSEDDLYVASWRFDGVIQIQRKQCGEYTVLARREGVAPPSADAWHRLRFEAAGDRLRLYLDHELALSATSETFSWGTAGIRIDSADGALIDDWRVY